MRCIKLLELEGNLETINFIPLFYISGTEVSIGRCELPNVTQREESDSDKNTHTVFRRSWVS